MTQFSECRPPRSSDWGWRRIQLHAISIEVPLQAVSLDDSPQGAAVHGEQHWAQDWFQGDTIPQSLWPRAGTVDRRGLSCPLNSSRSTSDAQCRWCLCHSRGTITSPGGRSCRKPQTSQASRAQHAAWHVHAMAGRMSLCTLMRAVSTLHMHGAACMPTGRVPQAYACVQVLRQPGDHHRLQQIGHKRRVVDWSVVRHTWQYHMTRRQRK